VLSLSLSVEVYLCTLPTDMRRGFDGLMRMSEEHLQRNVLQGGLFVFVNRQRDRVKLLYWDQDGLAIWYKRLERGTFALPSVDEETTGVTLSATDLAMLLGGVDLKSVRKRNRYQIPASV
jgi:transposase